MGRNMEKYCLKWNEFEANIRESFKTLREEERLFDVTLVTDDGQHIQAHKIVLSAGSNFFSDIFMKTYHSNMLIYLKGIGSAELEPITDFLYNGEVSITQEYLTTFLETAKVLQIKGLLGDLEGIIENTVTNQSSASRNTEHHESETKTDCYENSIAPQEMFGSLGELPDSFEIGDGTLVKPITDSNHELDLQIEGMVEKNEGLWICKVCGKTATLKGQVKVHAETHIEGVSHACHLCNTKASTRQNLRVHISRQHSELFSCDVCGRSGMN